MIVNDSWQLWLLSRIFIGHFSARHPDLESCAIGFKLWILGLDQAASMNFQMIFQDDDKS